MKKRYFQWLLLMPITVAAGQAKSQQANVQHTDVRRADVGSAYRTYETEFEVGNGMASLMYRVLFDNGRYRMEYNPSKWGSDGIGHGLAPLDPVKDFAEIYDATTESVVWDIFPKGLPCPSIMTVQYAYYQAFKRDGEATMKRRYHYIDDPLRRTTYILHSAYSRIPTRAKLENIGPVDVHKTGAETIAGFLCERYEGTVTITPRGPHTPDYVPPHMGVRFWLEPKTQLILKCEQHFPSFDRRTPPRREVFEVHKLTFLKSIPLSRFQIAPGQKVLLPEIIKDIPLPHGVARWVQDAITNKITYVPDAK